MHVSSPISETIHVSPLIITIKKNKIVSLLFNVGLNIFTTSHLPYSLPHLYIYVITFIHFNYLILKCSKHIKLNQMTSLHSLRVSVFFGNKIRQGMNAKELISQETTTNSSRGLGLGLGLGLSHDPPGTNIWSLVLVCEMIWFEPYD